MSILLHLSPWINITFCVTTPRLSQWPRALKCGSAAARLLRLWMSVVRVVWSGRGLCDDLITRPEESSGLWCVVVCDLETS